MRDRTVAARDSIGLVLQVWLVCVALAVTVAACVDETHALQVQALGDESPGVPKGPLHRPGQPCLVCHGEAGPASKEFVLAGTVFETQGKTDPAAGASVLIEDVTGSVYTATTNEVGNFYIAPADWSPTMPLQVKMISQGKNAEGMLTFIGRAGSCAECHTLTSGPTSPGPVYVVQPPAPTGGK